MAAGKRKFEIGAPETPVLHAVTEGDTTLCGRLATVPIAATFEGVTCRACRASAFFPRDKTAHIPPGQGLKANDALMNWRGFVRGVKNL